MNNVKNELQTKIGKLMRSMLDMNSGYHISEAGEEIMVLGNVLDKVECGCVGHVVYEYIMSLDATLHSVFPELTMDWAISEYENFKKIG